MNRQNVCVVAILALALVAFGQEQNEGRVEVRVVGPVGGVHSLEPIEIDLEDLDLQNLDLDGAGRAFILGVEGEPQDADAKGEAKAKRKQDAGKDTIVKEIDLGDGKTMRIIISTGKGDAKGLTRHWVGSTPEGFGVMKGDAHVFHRPEAMKLRKMEPFVSGEGFKAFKVFGPEGVHVEAFGQDVKDHMERALRAFDRAREEFIRAYKEGEKGVAPKERRVKGPLKGVTPEHLDRVIIGKAGESEAAEKAEAEKVATAKKAARAEKAEAHEKAVEKIKATMEEELKKAHDEATNARTSKRGAVQWVDTAPGASTKGEIDALRKEVRELEKMIRDLKDHLERGR